MKCPFCDQNDTRVLDSRLNPDHQQIRRRRSCNECGERFNTLETPILQWPRIIKRDQRREPFLEHKLRGGILRAFEKRPISTEQIETLMAHIKKKLISHPEREVNSDLVGEWVLSGLRSIDELAFLRFASIYKRVKKIEDFYALISSLSESTSSEERNHDEKTH
jgi:transcriptional repressor NrdR